MNNIVLEFLLWLAFSIMQSGTILATLEYSSGGGPVQSLFLMIPFLLLSLFFILLTTRVTIPRLLLKGKAGRFAIWEFGMAYVTCWVEQLITFYIWEDWNIIPKDHTLDLASLSLNALFNSVVFFFMLLALGGWRLFLYWKNDLKKEAILTKEIEHYISEVKRMIHPSQLLAGIKSVADKTATYPHEAEKDLRDITDRLRSELYHLPTPPADREENGKVEIENDPVNRFITEKKYKWIRVMFFQLSLVMIASSAFFHYPDSFEFSKYLFGAFVMLSIFEIIAGIVIFIFYRNFKKRRRIKGFILKSAILATLLLLPILIGRVIGYIQHPYNDVLFVILTLIATIATILMQLFYIGGITAYLLYKDWMIETRRLTLLNASSKRLEYAWLKKQINPHFLFNVLNNAHILVGVEPQEARRMLMELHSLLEYQFEETEREYTSLSQTIEFIKSYLSLEATRKENLTFNLSVEGDTDNIKLPSLIFIPFVENAVKYSSKSNRYPTIEILFSITGDNVIFKCSNPVNPERSVNDRADKGLGLTNTLRRLSLIYGSNFDYNVKEKNNYYHISLSLPRY